MTTASATAVVPALPASIPSQGDLPSSFQEALKLGWHIVKEETAIDAREHNRTGTVLMRLKGSAVQLRVPYTATPKEWKFGKPEAIEYSETLAWTDMAAPASAATIACRTRRR